MSYIIFTAYPTKSGTSVAVFTNVARSGVRLCVSVCLLGTRMSPAKTAEATKMPFGGRLTHEGPRKHVLYGDQARTSPFLRCEGVTRWRCVLSSKFFDHLV